MLTPILKGEASQDAAIVKLSPAIGAHPAAEAFPRMSPDRLRELADDIKANGQIHPIVRDAAGTILAGRNRLVACEMAEVAPRFETYTGDNPVAFIIADNLQRQHLNESQRALIASKLAAMSHGGDRKSDQVANLQLEIPKASVAAEMLNVSKRSLAYAAVVRKHGTPELIRKVEAGEMSVSAAAKLAQPPKPTMTNPMPTTKPEKSRKEAVAANKVERFKESVRFVNTACVSIFEHAVPQLTEADLAEVTEGIKEAIDALRTFEVHLTQQITKAKATPYLPAHQET